MFTEIQSRPRAPILSCSPHPKPGRWALLGDVRESFPKSISAEFYFVHFHFGKDLGAKPGPGMLALVGCFRETNEPDLRS